MPCVSLKLLKSSFIYQLLINPSPKNLEFRSNPIDWVSKCIESTVLLDFGSGSGKSDSEIRLFFENPAKSGSGQISNRICRICLLVDELSN